jgi:hypothetical protein
MADATTESLIALSSAVVHTADKLDATVNAYRRGEVPAADIRTALNAVLGRAALVNNPSEANRKSEANRAAKGKEAD